MPEHNGPSVHIATLGILGVSPSILDLLLLQIAHKVLVFVHFFSHTPATVLYHTKPPAAIIISPLGKKSSVIRELSNEKGGDGD